MANCATLALARLAALDCFEGPGTAQERAARLRRTLSEGSLDLPLRAEDERVIAYFKQLNCDGGAKGFSGAASINTSLAEVSLGAKAAVSSDGSVATCEPAPGPGSSLGGSTGRWADLEDVASAAPEAGSDAAALCSQGSAGHPEICNRPCLRLVAGFCPLGEACLFCHMSHTQRSPHLDRRMREVLSGATAADWLAVMEGALTKKVKATGSGAARGMLRATLAKLRQLPGGSAVGCRQQRALATAVDKIPLKALLSTASRTTRARSDEVADLFRDLLQQLRQEVGLTGGSGAEEP